MVLVQQEVHRGEAGGPGRFMEIQVIGPPGVTSSITGGPCSTRAGGGGGESMLVVEMAGPGGGGGWMQVQVLRN